jgi:hypothetical protein
MSINFEPIDSSNTVLADFLPKVSESEIEDLINKPNHYNSHPSGVQCFIITEQMSYHLGTVVAYVWRHRLKSTPISDLKKAAWHLNKEIEKLEREGVMDSK